MNNKLGCSFNNWRWEIGKMPFYYTVLDQPFNDEGLPDFLPFSVQIDTKTGTLVQISNSLVTDTLNSAYIKGSMISGMMDEQGIGRKYTEDFLSFLKSVLKRGDYNGLKILEIGCGNGYLLYRLKLMGADVIGVEPGPQGRIGALEFDIPIINDFFPNQEIQSKYDLIILYGVLEHIKDTDSFLSKVKECLTEEGNIAIAVPDCEPYIDSGDVSMFVHEHWNYYTETTLRNTIALNLGLDGIINKSSFGGVIYFFTTHSLYNGYTSELPIEKEIKRSINLKTLADIGNEKLINILNKTINNISIGIYVPGRIINALSIIKPKVNLSSVRFFDDNKLLHNKYFPGFNIPVESRQQLVNNSTEYILIMSNTFGEKIKEELRPLLNKSIQIATWNDIFS